MNDKRVVQILGSVDKTTSGGSWYLHFVGDEIRIEADHSPNTVAVLPWSDEGQANADYIIESFRYIRQLLTEYAEHLDIRTERDDLAATFVQAEAKIKELKAENADLRRQVADLSELLRREEARP